MIAFNCLNAAADILFPEITIELILFVLLSTACKSKNNDMKE